MSYFTPGNRNIKSYIAKATLCRADFFEKWAESGEDSSEKRHPLLLLDYEHASQISSVRARGIRSRLRDEAERNYSAMSWTLGD